ncbi:MAG: SGNH/GDSL hydrolase family protein [Lachnospiraceae bacterium]
MRIAKPYNNINGGCGCRKRMTVAALLLAAVFLTACTKTEQPDEGVLPNATVTPGEPEESGGTEAPSSAERILQPAWTDVLTEADMQVASPWKSCDNTALAAVMKKAEVGEPVTIACIGGSITQGVISSGPLDSEIKTKACYADIFFAWWKETFPNTEITVINAGIGGTDSYLGVHRVQEDVLDYHPDLVLVEYSVNDGADNHYKNSYDNLVRKILKSEDSPAVLLLFMAQTSLVSAQSAHQLIGFNYELPMVSHGNLLQEFFDTGRYTAEEMSGDVSHPSVFGHAIVGEMLWKYLNNVYAELDSYGEPVPFDKKAVTKERYQNAEMLGVGTIVPDALGTFTQKDNFYNWGSVWTNTEGDGEITFTVTCRNLGILFWRSTYATYGQYEIWVDGEYKAKLQANFKDGWGQYAYSQEIFVSEEEAEHTITIKKAADSTGDTFTLLRLLVSH